MVQCLWFQPLAGQCPPSWFLSTHQTNKQTKKSQKNTFIFKTLAQHPSFDYEETILVESSTLENRHPKLSPLQVLLFAYQIFMECLPCVGL